MTFSENSVTEPIPISVVAGRYLLFDTNVVTYLRRTYNICGVLIGGIPQIPQQNVFLGLPVELLPEETKILVRKGAAYIVETATWHQKTLSNLKGAKRRNYLNSLRSEGWKAQQIAEEISRKKIARGLAKQAALKSARELPAPTNMDDISITGIGIRKSEETGPNLFDCSDIALPITFAPSSSLYTVTETSTYIPSQLASQSPIQLDPLVPHSYPLFAYLHDRSYFITPGIRFGCDYTVYPGDPLRFHSHFLAVAYSWEEDIPLVELVGGGRLGTGVKKGFLIGGKGPTESKEDGAGVRTFCIEWGGM